MVQGQGEPAGLDPLAKFLDGERPTGSPVLPCGLYPTTEQRSEFEIGRPGETFRRARIASDFGKLTALDRRPTPRAGSKPVRAGSACRRERVGLARPEGGEADEAEEDHRPGRGLGHGNRDQPSGAGGNRHAQVERSERSVGLHLKSDD